MYLFIHCYLTLDYKTMKQTTYSYILENVISAIGWFPSILMSLGFIPFELSNVNMIIILGFISELDVFRDMVWWFIVFWILHVVYRRRQLFRFKSNEMVLHPSNFVAMGFSNTGHSTLKGAFCALVSIITTATVTL